MPNMFNPPLSFPTLLIPPLSFPTLLIPPSVIPDVINRESMVFPCRHTQIRNKKTLDSR